MCGTAGGQRTAVPEPSRPRAAVQELPCTGRAALRCSESCCRAAAQRPCARGRARVAPGRQRSAERAAAVPTLQACRAEERPGKGLRHRQLSAGRCARAPALPTLVLHAGRMPTPSGVRVVFDSACVTTKTRHLDRRGQLSEFENGWCVPLSAALPLAAALLGPCPARALHAPRHEGFCCHVLSSAVVPLRWKSTPRCKQLHSAGGGFLVRPGQQCLVPIIPLAFPSCIHLVRCTLQRQPLFTEAQMSITVHVPL